MNQRKAIPANGTMLTASHTALRLVGSRSQPELCAVSAGVDSRINTSAEPRSNEKTIPATAAARGVVSAGPRDRLIVVHGLPSLMAKSEGGSGRVSSVRVPGRALSGLEADRGPQFLHVVLER